ncbi:hypothetical protein VNO78_34950 [Psophocarpus tetragonolobus]|uniref:Uncharacterized protein n=1 Tax=Psophocarpus tetragonolobus TaxID=3891 RepID=A0AAN9RR94_PSOTE
MISLSKRKYHSSLLQPAEVIKRPLAKTFSVDLGEDPSASLGLDGDAFHTMRVVTWEKEIRREIRFNLEKSGETVEVKVKDIREKLVTRLYKDKEHAEIEYTVRDYKEDRPLQVTQPVAGNYHPLNLGIYSKDKKSEVSILVDRGTGGASIKDGEELDDGTVLRLAHQYEGSL